MFKAFLYGSETVKGGNVFRMLLLGLTTAMLDNDQQDSSDMITEVKEGDNIGSRLFAYTTPDRLGFSRTEKNFLVKKGHPGKKTKNFYVLDAVGRGKQGEVRLVVSSWGLPAAVKFYHFKPSRLATPDDREKENKSRIAAARRDRDEELKLWKDLYGDRGAREVKLGGFPCLLMPYGTRIPMEDRSTSLKSIERDLIKFSKKGLAYKKTDLRWRHVLKDQNGKLFLSDLASLELIPDGHDRSKIVEQQMRHLRETLDGTRVEANLSRASPTKRSAPGGKSTPKQRRKFGNPTKI